MSLSPQSYIAVPAQTTLISQGYTVKYTGYATETTELGIFDVINDYFKKGDKITMDEVKQVKQNYSGEFDISVIERVMEKRKHFGILIGYIVDFEVHLRNIMNYTHDTWAVLIATEDVFVPCLISIDFDRPFKYIDNLDAEDYKDLIGPCIVKSSPEELNLDDDNYSIGSEVDHNIDMVHSLSNEQMEIDNVIFDSMDIQERVIRRQKEVADWFHIRERVKTAADGLCGAHALYHALLDIGVEIRFQDIVGGLNRYEYREYGWWNIATLRAYCEELQVKMYTYDNSSGRVVYWYTTYESDKIIGIYANGVHYEWARLKKFAEVIEEPLSPKKNQRERKRQKRSHKNSLESISEEQATETSLFNAGSKEELESLIDAMDSMNKFIAKSSDSNNFILSAGEKDLICTTELTGVRKEIYESVFFCRLPHTLQQFILYSDYEDIGIEYEIPYIYDKRDPDHSVDVIRSSSFTPYLPHRLDNPLVKLPDHILNFITSKKFSEINKLHSHHSRVYLPFSERVRTVFNEKDFPDLVFTNDIKYLKEIARSEYGYRWRTVSRAANATTISCVNNDMSIALKQHINLVGEFTTPPPYPSILLLYQRLRAYLTIQNVKHEKTDDEFMFNLAPDGTYIIRNGPVGRKFVLLSCGHYFAFWHEDVGKVFISVCTYLDYTIAYCEVRHNLAVLSCSREYSSYKDMFNYLLEHSEKDIDHNISVTFMKNYEGFLLNLSDILESPFVNWAPIIDTASEMVRLSNEMSEDKTSIAALLFDLLVCPQSFERTNDLHQIVNICKVLKGREIQELSSLHKFLYYAEVDQQKGLDKYLKRVHTDRPFEPEMIENMIRTAKRQFVITYHSRHHMLPNFKYETEETLLLQHYHDKKSITSVMNQPLVWWDNVIPWNCLDNTTTNDPLEVAKDKGALLEKIRCGPGDSKKELLQIIEQEESTFEGLDLSDMSEVIDPEIVLRHKSLADIDEPYPTRLIPKEKEQKVEARLFGNTTTKNKHGLSILMNKAKKALSYFDTEVMTKTDKSRKERLHNMAQDLLHPNNFAVLLDIEGHNQSMQQGNCSKLYEFVGNLFGENEWGNLSNYFNQLFVYFYDEYEDLVVSSKGQKGGIEGWMNPLWTLHTALIVDMINECTNLNVQSKSVYSDDVALIVKFDSVDQRYSDDVFRKIRDHFFKFGMIVKMSQTAVSKNRITMLRQHYYKGERADSTLKRLLAMSSYNNAIIVAEELESAGVTSASASAMELTEHVLSVSYLKWYHLFIINYRLLGALFELKRENSIIEDEEFPQKIKSLIWTEAGDLTMVVREDNFYAMMAFREQLQEYMMQANVHDLEMTFEDMLALAFGHNGVQLNQLKRIDLVVYLLTEEDFLHQFLWFFITLPTSLGGKGGSFTLTEILSGHSDGFYKHLYYLKSWIDNYSVYKKFFYRWLENSLSHTNEGVARISESSLCVSTWSGSPDIITVNGMIYGAVKRYFESTCENRKIKKLLETDSHRVEFQNNMVNLFRKELQPRILQFYSETSIFHILDVLIKKVETSSGFLYLLRGIGHLRSKIHRTELNNFWRCITNNSIRYGKINHDTDMLSYLIARRQKMYPSITFDNTNEPLYDHLLSKTFNNDYSFSVVLSRKTHYHDNRKVYKSPIFGSEALYKGELISEDSMFSCVEELLMTKLVSITRWIANKSGHAQVKRHDSQQPLVVVLANYSLSTLSKFTYHDLLPYVPLTTGGEILHRIPNMRFKTNVIIRAMPSTSVIYYCAINQVDIIERDLVDSNIHFDYVRCRLIVQHALRGKYTQEHALINHYRLLPSQNIHDVSDYVIKATTSNRHTFYTSYSEIINRESVFTRINQIAYNLAYRTDPVSIGTLIRDFSAQDLDSTEEFILQEVCLKYYRELQNNRMTLSYKYDSISTWLPLIIQLRDKFHIGVDLDNDDAYLLIQNSLDTYRRNAIERRYEKRTDIDHQHIVTRLLESSDFELNKLDAVLSRIKTLIHDHGMMEQNNKFLEDKTRMRTYIRKYSHLKTDLERSFGYYITLKYCATFLFEKNQLVVNRAQTSVYLNLLISNPRAFLADSPSELIFLEILTSNNDLQFLYPYFDEFYDSIDENVIQYDLSDVLKFNVGMGLSVAPRTKTILPYSKVALSVDYTLEKVDRSLFGNHERVHSTLVFARHCVSLYSNVEVYTSSTASDSFCAQYGLFKALLKYNYITHDTKICDLTAGRGDGQDAATQLGLNLTSYSRKDIFTVSEFRNKVIFKDDYDIFKTETLGFILIYDHIHIDVSYTGTELNDVTSLILYLCELKRNFSVRLNSVTWSEEIMETTMNIPNYNYYISIPSEVGLKPYQVYLVGVAVKKNTMGTNTNVDDSLWHRLLVRSYSQLIRKGIIFTPPHTYSRNSSTVLFEVDEQPINLISSMLVDESFSSHTRTLQHAAKTRYLLDNVIISLVNLPPVILSEYKDLLMTLENIEGPEYTSYNFEDVGGKSKPQIMRWQQHLKFIKENKTGLYRVPLTGKYRELFDQLQYSHPLKVVRGAIIAHIASVETEDISFGADEFQIQEVLNKFRADVSPNFPQTNKTMRIAYLLLAFSASLRNYAYGLVICWSRYHIPNINKHETIRIIEEYRKLSPLYYGLTEDMRDNLKVRELRDEIKSKIIFPLLRQYVAARENKKVTKMIRKTEHEESIELPDLSQIRELVQIGTDQDGGNDDILSMFTKAFADSMSESPPIYNVDPMSSLSVKEPEPEIGINEAVISIDEAFSALDFDTEGQNIVQALESITDEQAEILKAQFAAYDYEEEECEGW